ncbi:prolyl oligopeptidase family serine peptidase [bacterium]|nr:prolyl oligopeptidase family serine peptidase [bacterium]
MAKSTTGRSASRSLPPAHTLWALSLPLLVQCTQPKPSMTEPIAPQKPHVHKEHGQERLDPYFWLKERENPEVLDYLRAENEYRAFVMKATEPLQKQLFEEIKGRIKEDDASVPYVLDGYHYYTRYEIGGEHPIYCRKKGHMEAPEEVMLNANELAQGHSYYQIGGMSVSPDGRWLAYGEDTVGRRIYTLKFKDLKEGKAVTEQIPNTTGGLTWANDNKTGFYTVRDESLRSYKVFRHVLGTPASADVEVYHEKDDTYNTFIYKTKSRKYLVIGSGSTLSDEYRICPADQPTGTFEVFQERERGLEYDIAHFEDRWYIRTNLGGATNFKLMQCREGQTQKHGWDEFIPHRPGVYFESFQIFKDYLVLDERENGLTRLRIKPWSGPEHEVAFPDKTFTAGLAGNPEFDTPWLRYSYSSLTQPNSVIDYHMENRTQEVRKVQEVVGGYDPNLYASQRIWATAVDGVRVPISLVYRKDLFKGDSSNPLLLYGYGSYGITVEPRFSSARLSLLDRGFVFAIAHIRGGQYLGRSWYEDGKLLKKKNTFTDFIACAEHLIAERYTSAAHLYAEGGSAGGLLMGAVANMRPDLFNGLLVGVPFVDVVTTMLDESIPLTTGEYDEWGNPNEKEYYDYMLSYSPYDNVKAQDYPAMLVTTGLHDSQVQYWEPAKWVARLRALRTNQRPLLLETNMETGHSGASGRFESIVELAMEYAFLLDMEGISE